MYNLNSGTSYPKFTRAVLVTVSRSLRFDLLFHLVLLNAIVFVNALFFIRTAKLLGRG